jgi:hypothetical protein
MDVVDAARRWGRTWERAWAEGDVDAIVALYAPDAVYRSHPHRDPEIGGALGYVSRVFGEESNVQCWFGEPIASGDRAAVEWWANLDEQDGALNLTGATILRFAPSGLVVEHVDYWVQSEDRLAPFEGWGGR